MPQSEKTKDRDLIPGMYRHCKGGLYKVTGCAEHSETGERMVVYVSTDGEWWVRPLSMFRGYHSSGLPRFTRVLLPE